ncbi:hypothetical protein OPV22_010856 [Ensete ventricosum]|uniref:MLO-like protein n=1 Tax=Ensete ventricosum TaxID=4639 RepID=A0AAV8PWV2_ENSVE|nr:hypothetical protein OPV22_010856 [Ensete ventricosum]
MLPCKETSFSPNQEVHHAKGLKLQLTWNNQKLLSEDEGSDTCMSQVLKLVVHVVFCATTMVLGGVKIRKWKVWENDIRKLQPKKEKLSADELSTHVQQHHEFLMEHTAGLQQRSVVLSWIMSFLKQFYASVTKSDYRALRSGDTAVRIQTSTFTNICYELLRMISRLLLMVLVAFCSLIPLAECEWMAHIFLAVFLASCSSSSCRYKVGAYYNMSSSRSPQMNAFELAYFFWIMSTYGFYSCIMEKVGYIVPRLVVGVIIQVLCSYSTLPLYAIVTQMGDMFKQAIFDEQLRSTLHGWAETIRKRKKPKTVGVSSFMKVINSKSKTDVSGSRIQMQNATLEADGSSGVAERPIALESKEPAVYYTNSPWTSGVSSHNPGLTQAFVSMKFFPSLLSIHWLHQALIWLRMAIIDVSPTIVSFGGVESYSSRKSVV